MCNRKIQTENILVAKEKGMWPRRVQRLDPGIHGGGSRSGQTMHGKMGGVVRGSPCEIIDSFITITFVYIRKAWQCQVLMKRLYFKDKTKKSLSRA